VDAAVLGHAGQYVSYATYDIAEDFTNGAWGTIYQGGGLQDLRLISRARTLPATAPRPASHG
jgi:hypothetical protein